MFRNQYFITNHKILDTNLNFEIRKFSNLWIHFSAELPMSYAQSKGTEIVILGYIINPFAPAESDHDICLKLTNYNNIKEFMCQIQNLSGRYVILYKTYNAEIAISDALGHRQIYYYLENKNVFITSSPKLFLRAMNFTLHADEEKLEIIKSKEFQRNENAWFGSESVDNRLKKVLPNHYLDLKKLRIYRRYYDVNPLKDENDIRNLCGRILKGGIAGAVRRYNIMEPITAGCDSRVLLAASKDYKKKIRYYIFQRPDLMSKHSADLEVPKKLSEKLGISFEIITTEPLSDEFIELYTNEHIVPRILSKTQNIQYHYYNSRCDGKILDVKGSGGEVLRCFYGQTPFGMNYGINAEVLACLSGYSGNKYFTNRIREWLIEAVEFAKTYNIPIQDLFYWEQRMGNWGADHGLEQDIAIEEFWPFNNATLLLNGLNVKISKRSWPKYIFFKQLMTDLWPEVLCEPINPKKGFVRTLGHYVNGYIKSYSHLRFLSMQLGIDHIFRDLRKRFLG